MNNKTIIFIHKAEFHKRPPVISVMHILLDLGHKPILITSGINDDMRNKLQGWGVDIHVSPFRRKRNRINKVVEYYMFRKKAFDVIKQFDKDEILLWIEGAQTVVALGTKINKYDTILQIQELHNHSRLHMRYMRKTLPFAKNILMPEYNRSVLYQVWFKLPQRPVVLPNKPYFVPSTEELRELEEKYSDYVKLFKTYKVILYQGILFAERDLSQYIKAVKTLAPEYKLVLLGEDLGMLKKYRKIDPDLIHIDFIPAPDYLLFSSLAHIGIASYDPMDLNTAYCAPNKIYEYSAFSLPILANDVPGLNSIITKHNAGVIVDEQNQDSIIKGIKTISADIDKYKKNVRNIYDSVDNKETIRNVLSGIMSN